jgi:hypothetical protein
VEERRDVGGGDRYQWIVDSIYIRDRSPRNKAKLTRDMVKSMLLDSPNDRSSKRPIGDRSGDNDIYHSVYLDRIASRFPRRLLVCKVDQMYLPYLPVSNKPVYDHGS